MPKGVDGQAAYEAVYEVEYVKDGRKVEVKIAEDGTLMTGCKHGEGCQKCCKQGAEGQKQSKE